MQNKCPIHDLFYSPCPMEELLQQINNIPEGEEATITFTVGELDPLQVCDINGEFHDFR